MDVALIQEDETLEDLQCKGLHVLQKKQGFRFGVDAVLLAHFSTIEGGAKVLDLGTGSGVIPLLITAKNKAKKIVGVEIQEDLVDMAKRSVRINGLEALVEIRHGDIKNLNYLGSGSWDTIVSNPPYTKLHAGIRCADRMREISRHEVACNLEDVIRTAATLLRIGGHFGLVHKPERLADILCTLRAYQIEPKYLQFVHPHPQKKPNIVLVKGVRKGRADLKILPPLYIFNAAGQFSEEIQLIYNRNGEQSDER